MRIIVVNDHGYVTGGAAQVAISSLNALADAGNEVTFVSSVPPVDSSIDTSKVRVINFSLTDLLSNPSRFNAAIHGIWDFRCASRFRALLNEYSRENTVIHFHNWTKSLSPSVLREALQRQFKIVITLHDYFSVCPNGGLFDYVSQKHCTRNPMSISCALTNCDMRSYAQKQWRFARHTLQNVFAGTPSLIHNFISISDYSENLLKPHLSSHARFFRVRNPIDISKAPPLARNPGREFAFVGRLSTEKGASLFATAARLANVQAVFVGQGPEIDRVRESNPNAVVLGWQNKAGVISQMRRSRAIVFPSLWHETQGLVVHEAAALGIPSIVSDDCAARDGIVDGKNGLLVRSGDTSDLAEKLEFLDHNPQLALKLGHMAYERYWSNPSTLATHVAELLSCYKEILK
jgi:glycosyltransferase involved in cell wall biosynthesis